MRSTEARRKRARTRSRLIEQLEDRQVMSADPVGAFLGGTIQQSGLDAPTVLVQHGSAAGDFWIDSWSERDVETLAGDLEQTLASAHNSTGLTSARNDYGFTGAGQTVAVIDSGIAWSHSALGGGLGASYRVVGGWDFTENDADPYDDGPWGSHGTHVAGIVGANAAGTNYDGVATGVDLVGLRVFDDAGAGYFHWVESALRWVHQNRSAFENPITAVNLSLGTTWNSSSIPSWTTLEDEFAQLKADGIFIAVSAGNSFSSYNTPGLSYPAASPSVVPVMSVMDNGNLSSFSQRHTRAIAAPGQYIVSSVPDYIGNNNGVNDDFASFSGTSMASPYIAGASVLLRQAMQFVGYTSITQDTIYNHMMSTATSFLDSATGQTYKRLNLANAVNTLMPADEYGSTAAAAHNLGTLNGEHEVRGLIGKLSDADFFQFTAAATGTVTFTATTTNGLAPLWAASGGVVSGSRGETYTFDVVAGQTYTVGLSTNGGIGYYNLAIEAESAFAYSDWGTVTQSLSNNVANAGETWYRVTASRSGYLTAEALFAATGGNVDVAIFNSNMQLLSTGAANALGERVDVLATGGTDYFIRVTGSNADIDFRLTNLVSHSGTTVSVAGTPSADVFTFSMGTSQHIVTVNNVTYSFARDSAQNVSLDGAHGADTVVVTASASKETVSFDSQQTVVAGANFNFRATGFEDVTVFSGGGGDVAHFHDTAGDDTFSSRADRALLVGSNASFDARNFAQVFATASAGHDRATFHGTAGNDKYVGWSDRATMSNRGYLVDARGFDSTVAVAELGRDQAIFYDSAGDDLFYGWSDRATMSGNGYSHEARGFDSTTAYSTSGGYDQAVFYDSVGNDVYTAWFDRAMMRGASYHHDARGFDRTTAHSTLGGLDRSVFYDSPADDVYEAWSNRAVMRGTGYYNDARGFSRTTAYSTNGGYDQTVFYSSSSREDVRALAWGAYISDSNYRREARGFDVVTAITAENGSTVIARVGAIDYAFNQYGNRS